MKIKPVITLILVCVASTLAAPVKTYNTNELSQTPIAERSTLSALTAPVTNIVNIITNTFICSGNASFVSIICGNQGGNTTPGPVNPPATTPEPPQTTPTPPQTTQPPEPQTTTPEPETTTPEPETTTPEIPQTTPPETTQPPEPETTIGTASPPIEPTTPAPA